MIARARPPLTQPAGDTLNWGPDTRHTLIWALCRSSSFFVTVLPPFCWFRIFSTVYNEQSIHSHTVGLVDDDYNEESQLQFHIDILPSLLWFPDSLCFNPRRGLPSCDSSRSKTLDPSELATDFWRNLNLH